MKRESLTLKASEWRALDVLAQQTGSTAKRGTRMGRYSWRTLVKRIARGEFTLWRDGKAYRVDANLGFAPLPPETRTLRTGHSPEYLHQLKCYAKLGKSRHQLETEALEKALK